MRYRQENLLGEKWSFILTSVWGISVKDPFLQRLCGDETEYRETKRTGGALGSEGIRFSEFKADVAYRVIEYWGEKIQTVLDPFAGRFTRMMVSLHLGKNYIGYDVVSEYVQINRERYEKVQKDYPNQSVRLFTGDGCKMENLGDASQEFIFTCPPYFNLEEYKNAPGQLSRLSTYGKFLERINECLVNCFRVLKRDSFMVFVVGDWHRDGKFYCFHNDFISLAKNNKFELWDIVINRVYSPFVVFAMSQNERFKWMGKAHEYILVFKKL